MATKSGNLLLVAGLAFAAVAAVLVFSLAFGTGWLLLWLAVPLLILRFSRRWLNQAPLSPITIAVVFLVVVAGLGYYVGDRLAGAGGTGGVDGADLLAGMRAQTGQLICVAATCIAIGGSIAARITGRRNPGLKFRVAPARYVPLILLGCMVPLVLIVGNGGIEAVFYRTTYLQPSAGGIFRLGPQLALPAVLALGFLSAHRKIPVRFAAYVLLVAYALSFFSMGSRRLALFPILFAIGYFVAKPSKKRAWAVFAVAGLAAVWLIQIQLFLRGLPAHGLVPYFAALPEIAEQPINLPRVANNILVSFPIIALTAYGSPQIPVGHIMTSLNPLPGATVGWYEISRQLRLNEFTPFAGMGELGNVGYTAVVPFFLIVGLLFGYFEGRVRRLISQGHQMVSLVFVGLPGLFVIYCVQYNLRTSVRMLVYAIAADVLVRIALKVFQPSRERKREVPRWTAPARG